MENQGTKKCVRCQNIKKLYLFIKYTRKGMHDKKKRISDICYECWYGKNKGQPKFLWKFTTKNQQKTHIKKLFEKHVIKQNGCWDWDGYINSIGYAVLQINKRHHNASRVSWSIYKGELTDKQFVCHTCDNRRCTNPDHLFLGSAKDNMQDMIKKKRDNFLKGESCPWSDLTESQILEMLKLFEQGANSPEIARKYNISREHARDIKLGKRWGHVGDRSKIKKVAPAKKILTEDTVRQIKKRFAEGARICDVMKEFVFSRSTIDDIKKERTWKHIY